MDKDKLQKYMDLKYKIVVEPAESGYLIYIPDLPGCVTQCNTADEIMPKIEEAKSAWLGRAIEAGMEIPVPDNEFNLRLPVTLYKRLKEKSKVEKVSINQLAIYYIADGLAK